jgi:hypothetical protein
MAATALAIGAGGALSSVQTTVLLTVDVHRGERLLASGRLILCCLS